jgi:hypothetical protein
MCSHQLEGMKTMPFGSAKCPVTKEDKRWIEEAMLWFVDQLGSKALCQAEVILPTEEYFPDKYLGTQISAEKVVWRVCDYMGIDPSTVQGRIYAEQRNVLPADSPLYHGIKQQHTGTAGMYGAAGRNRKGKRLGVVGIEASKLENPPAVVAAAAHEVGHHILVDKRLPQETLARECLTDLVPVFLGLGILTANAAFRFFKWQRAQASGWEASRQGYLSEETYGYALACFAWMRNEENPVWAKHLTLNIRTYLKKSLKYLHKTRDTSLPVYASVAAE